MGELRWRSLHGASSGWQTRVDVSKAGYRRFTTEIEVGDGQTIPLYVSLITTS